MITGPTMFTPNGDDARRAGLGALFLEDVLLHRIPAGAAVLHRPAGRDPALLVQDLLPAHVVFLAQPLVLQHLAADLVRQAAGARSAHLVAKSLLFAGCSSDPWDVRSVCGAPAAPARVCEEYGKALHAQATARTRTAGWVRQLGTALTGRGGYNSHVNQTGNHRPLPARHIIAQEASHGYPRTGTARNSSISSRCGCPSPPTVSSRPRRACWWRPRTCTTPPTTAARSWTASPACGR